MSNRKGYIEWIPRVSDIVSFVYPFSWTNSELRFIEYVESFDIPHYEYMKKASELWTTIHNLIDSSIRNIEIITSDYKWYIDSSKKFIEDYKLEVIESEKYILIPDTYQWTIDLVWRISEEDWIIDWKTYWLAKKFFGLPIWKYRKPYDKLKKASLQLSLYWKALWINNIWVVELLEDWYFFHKLKRVDDNTLNDILISYKKFLW